MKIYKYIAILCLIMFCSCTQNNGRIGDLFGSWNLDEMLVGNEKAALPEGTYTSFSFQGNIVMVTLSEGPELMTKTYGTWVRDDDRLVLDFTHHSDSAPEGTGGFQAPQWLGFPASGKFDMLISALDGSAMTLVWDKPGAETRVYKFSKTW